MEIFTRIWSKSPPLVKGWLFRFTNFLGLAYITDYSRQPISDLSPDDKNTLEQYKAKIPSISGNELTDIVEDLNRRMREEDERKNLLEGKALSLLGFTGIALTLLLGLLSIPISEDNTLSLNCFIVSLMLAGICLLLSAFLSLKVTTVGEYKFAEPDIENMLAFAEQSGDAVWQGQAVDLVASYLKNRILINHKATFVIGSQKWFQNAIFCLLVGLLAVSLNFLLAGEIISSETATQSPGLCPTSATGQIGASTQTLVSTPSPIPYQTDTPVPTVTESP